MSVPDFQTFLSPLLSFAADGKEHTVKEARENIAAVLKLTEADLAEKIESGQEKFKHRVQWAKIYLDRAGALSAVKRGTFIITQRGKALLKENLPRITVKDLRRYPEFESFYNRDREKSESQPDSKSGETPDEIMARAHADIQNNVASELLEKIKSNSPEFFEQLVVDLMIKMGYGGSRQEAGESVGKSGDEGIDGVIKEDKLGLDMIYLQAKKWDGSVGRPEIQKFAGALQGKRAKKGVFITTGTFTADARSYAKVIDTKVILIDGALLVRYMMEFNLGVSTIRTFEIKSIDSDYFAEE